MSVGLTSNVDTMDHYRENLDADSTPTDTRMLTGVNGSEVVERTKVKPLKTKTTTAILTFEHLHSKCVKDVGADSPRHKEASLEFTTESTDRITNGECAPFDIIFKTKPGNVTSMDPIERESEAPCESISGDINMETVKRSHTVLGIAKNHT